jgi:hypothetical protein
VDRLLEDFQSGYTGDWEEETSNQISQGLSNVQEEMPGPMRALVRGVGEALYQGASIGSLVGSAMPFMSGAGISNYAISGKASDLIKPYFFGDSPTSKKLRAMYKGFDEAFEGDSYAGFGKFIGEWGPMLWAVGRVGSFFTNMFVKSAPTLTKAAGEMAAKNMPKFGKALEEAGAAIPVRRAAEIAGERLGPAPMFERMIMAGGMATGFGGYEFTRELADSGDFELAIKVGALSGGLGLGLEVAGVTAFRTLFPKHAATVDVKGLNKVWEEASPKVREAILSGDKKAIKALNWKKELLPRRISGEPNPIDFLDTSKAMLNRLIDLEGISYPSVFVDYVETLPLDKQVRWFQTLSKYFKGYDETTGFGKLASQMGAYDKSTRKWLEGLGADPKPMEQAWKEFTKKKSKIQAAEQEFRLASSNINTIEQVLAQTSSGRRAIMSDLMSSRMLIEAGREETARWQQRYAAEHMGKSVRTSTVAGLGRAKFREWKASTAAGWMGKIKLAQLSSPDGVAKQLGAAGIRFLEANERAHLNIELLVSKAFNTIDDMNTQITPLLEKWSSSFKPPEAPVKKFTTKNNEHLVELQHTYEIAQLTGVKEKYGEEIAKIWQKGYIEPIETVGSELEKTGLIVKRTREEMIAHRTPGHAPHVMDDFAGDFDKVERMIDSSLRARGMKTEQINEFMNSLEHRRKGLAKFGNIDHQRMLEGSALEKITGTYRGAKKSAPPIPLVRDPVRAYKLYMDAAIHRTEMGKIAGPNGELGSFWKALMIQSGADERAAHWLVDTAFYGNVADHGIKKLLRNVLASQVITKLSWVPLANFFQPNMTATRIGARKAGIGLAKAAGDVAAGARWTQYWGSLDKFTNSLASSDKPTIASVVGIMEKSMLSAAEIYKGARSRTFLEKVAEKELQAIGFTAEERLWRVGAAHAGLLDVRETIDKIVQGKLIGQNLTNARRSMDSLGVDVDEVIRRSKISGRLGLTQEEIGLVSQQAIKQTQFTTGVLDVPPGWKTPRGRLFTQFKSFSFNAGKITRDQILREFDHGNYRPLVYWLSLGGMSGEAISATVDAMKDRPHNPPDGPARLVAALSHQGGFGLSLSAAQAAFYGRPLEWVMGPTISDVASIAKTGAQSIAYGSPGPFLEYLAKQPVSQLIGAAYHGASELAKIPASAMENGWWWGDTSTEETGMSMDELRRSFKLGGNL